MSDSEDDRPLAALRPKPEHKSPRAVQPARKASQAADSSSEDDVPLAAKRAATKESKSHGEPTPKPKQEPGSGPKRGAGPTPKPASKPASGGKAKAKAEPLSKKAGAEAGIKKEPRVKREFGLPGQTRDTPDEARTPPRYARSGGARPGGVRRRSNRMPSLCHLTRTGRPSAQVLHVAAAAATGERDGAAVVRAVRAAAAR